MDFVGYQTSCFPCSVVLTGVARTKLLECGRLLLHRCTLKILKNLKNALLELCCVDESSNMALFMLPSNVCATFSRAQYQVCIASHKFFSDEINYFEL